MSIWGIATIVVVALPPVIAVAYVAATGGEDMLEGLRATLRDLRHRYGSR